MDEVTGAAPSSARALLLTYSGPMRFRWPLALVSAAMGVACGGGGDGGPRDTGDASAGGDSSGDVELDVKKYGQRGRRGCHAAGPNLLPPRSPALPRAFAPERQYRRGGQG